MNGWISETAEGDGHGKGRVQWRFQLFYNSTYEFCLTTGKLDTTCMYTKTTRKSLSKKKIQV